MFYVVILRESKPSLLIGPYETEDVALFAMVTSNVVTRLIEEECLSCFLAFAEEVEPLLASERGREAVDLLTVKQDDPDFFGRENVS